MEVNRYQVQPGLYEQSNNNCSAPDRTFHMSAPPCDQFVMTGDVMLNVNSSLPTINSNGTSTTNNGSIPQINYQHNKSADEFTDGNLPPYHSSNLEETKAVNGQSKCSQTNTHHTNGTHGQRNENGRPSDSANGRSQKVDEPSAQRLAKRLFALDGFKRSDVASHLTRDNQFSRKVNEEYLKLFDFGKLNLVEALRKFLGHFALVGETQERERVLNHFANRYLDCNPSLGDIYRSPDACHTLTCALMLLNTDLHGQNVGRKMTLSDFIENLSELNDGQSFSKDLLKACYSQIKHRPLLWAKDEGGATENTTASAGADQQAASLHNNTSFLSVPSHEGVESKSGRLQKKHCYEQDLKLVSTGKRSWKNHHVVLKGMAMYLLRSPKVQIEADTKVILLHHSLAQVARNYKKKPFVFLLRTADWSEYLFSTSSAPELESWVNQINMMSAEFSAEPLAAGVGSQMKFHRPLFPSSYTRLDQYEQYSSHEQKVEELRLSITEEENDKPDKSCSRQTIANYNEKLSFLRFELQRYMIYASLLKVQLDDNTSIGAPSFPSLPERSCNLSEIGSIASVDSVGLEPPPSMITNSPRSTTRYSYLQAVDNGFLQ